MLTVLVTQGLVRIIFDPPCPCLSVGVVVVCRQLLLRDAWRQRVAACSVALLMYFAHFSRRAGNSPLIGRRIVSACAPTYRCKRLERLRINAYLLLVCVYRHCGQRRTAAAAAAVIVDGRVLIAAARTCGGTPVVVSGADVLIKVTSNPELELGRWVT